MIQFRSYGSFPYTVAVVHGGPGAGGEMAPVARELQKYLPGILEPIQTATTLQGQIQELHSVLSAQCSLPVLLIGYSWGAWLSTFVAAQYSNMVKKLILIGCPPFEEKYVPQIMESRMNHLEKEEQEEFQSALAALSINDSENKDNLFSRLGYLAGKADSYDPLPNPDHDRDRIGTHATIFKNVFNEAAQWRSSGKMLAFTKTISCPVIAIHGDYDSHPGEGVERPLRQTLPNFRFVTLEKCGHTPWLERHARDAFYEILLEEILSEK